MNSQIDFGYPWWLSYGHLILLAAVLGLLWIGRLRRWSKFPMLSLGVIALWAFSGFMVARFMLNVNGRAALPTDNFLTSGEGTVLDMGAGTGRSTIMVLNARPRAHVVALDLFGTSFEQHFGPGDSPELRLASNLKAAGFEQRAEVRRGDMRELPFPPASFDAVVSSYAIDHLSREGIDKSLREAARVLKPRGEFLLMLIGKDPWAKFAFGPLLAHGGARDETWWTARLKEAGFEIAEQGMQPITLYYLARTR